MSPSLASSASNPSRTEAERVSPPATTDTPVPAMRRNSSSLSGGAATTVRIEARRREGFERPGQDRAAGERHKGFRLATAETQAASGRDDERETAHGGELRGGASGAGAGDRTNRSRWTRWSSAPD